MHGDGLADDETIANEFADRLTGIGVGDFVNLVGVEPYLALATADHGGGEALLRPEVDPIDSRWLVLARKVGRTSRVEIVSVPLVWARHVMAVGWPVLNYWLKACSLTS